MIGLSYVDLVIFSCCAVVIGIFLLIRGGNMTVDGAVSVAEKLGISPLVIAFTVVAFGTSLPELIVSVNSALKGSPGIAIGNVVGSNIANILLILGISAAIAPFTVHWKSSRNDFAAMLASTLFLMLLFRAGEIGRIAGFALFLSLVAYVVFQIIQSRKNHIGLTDENVVPVYETTIRAATAVAIGLILLAAGADVLVRGAVELAKLAGVTDTVIGLTVIAIGTSLPELTVAITASRKKNNETVIGTVIGSNVFNILCILGLTSVISPLPLGHQDSFDIYFMSAVASLFALRALMCPRIGRTFGVFMLVLYGMFLAIQF